MFTQPDSSTATMDWLCFDYGIASLLLPRKICRSNLYLPASSKAPSARVGDTLLWPLTQSLQIPNGQELAVFDLEAWAVQNFGLTQQGNFPLAVYLAPEALGPRTYKLIDEFYTSQGYEAPQAIALKIGREMALAKIRQSEQKSFHSLLSPHLARHGISACSFHGTKGIRYFLDPDALILNTLEKAASHADIAG